MNSENYYEILGVEKTATQDEIKKAYRNLAKENHPDKGGDSEKFKKISVAYDILGDENKRRDYDNPPNQFGGFGFNDIFNQMFNQNRQQRVHDTVLNLDLTVFESFLGVNKKVKFKVKEKCNTCNGEGGDKKTCNTCKGQGSIMMQIGSGMFIQMVNVNCTSCNGQGYIYTRKCNTCNGTTSTDKLEELEIKIPHGIDNGQFLRMNGKGDYKNGVIGNLVVKINLTNIENFEKVGHNLVYNKFFTLDEIQKDSFDIPHPGGKLNVKFPNNIDTSVPMRIKGKGFSIDGYKGDLLINQFLKFSKN